MSISNSSQTTGLGQRMILSMAIAGVIGGAGSALAASATFLTTTTDGNFATGANWDTGIAPGSVGTTNSTDTATFGRNAVSAIVVDANRNVQNITFNPTTAGSTTFNYQFSGGPLVLTSGGAIVFGGTGLASSSINTNITLGGNYTFEADGASNSRVFTFGVAATPSTISGLTGPTTLTLTGTTVGATQATNVINDAITDGTGVVSVNKTGLTTWQLNGANTYTGGTTVTGGTLVSASATPSAQIGTGAVTLNGGTLRLSGTTSTLTNALATTANGGFISVKGGSFNPSAITGTGAFSIGIDTAGTYTPVSFQNFGGTVNVNANSGSVTLRLGTNLTTGAFDATSLQNAALNLGSGVSVSRGFGTNGAQTVVIGTLSGVAGSTLGAAATGNGVFTYSVGGRNESSTFAGTIITSPPVSGNASTSTAITKTGTGTLTLTGVNTYNGLTSITGGTIALSGTGSIASSATISVGAAGTLDTTAATSFALGGTQALALAGTFRGTLAANATTTITPGGTLAVGAANVNNTTLVAGTTFTADTSSVLVGGDTLNVVGTIDLGGATLALNELATPTIGEIITLVNNDGTDPTVGTFAGLANGATVTSGADSFVINYNAGVGLNDVTLTAITGTPLANVPEPTTLAAVGLAGSLLIKRRRRA